MKYTKTEFNVLFEDPALAIAFSQDQYFIDAGNPAQNSTPTVIAKSSEVPEYLVAFTLWHGPTEGAELTELIGTLAEEYSGQVDSDAAPVADQAEETESHA